MVSFRRREARWDPLMAADPHFEGFGVGMELSILALTIVSCIVVLGVLCLNFYKIGSVQNK